MNSRQKGADMAVTDDERREVARRLRRLNGNVSHVRRVYENEGSSILCNDQADYYQICCAVAGYIPADHMHPCDYEELHARLADLIEPQPITGDTSDGYHTFNELYDHRAKLFSVIVQCFKDRAWKSKFHHDGTMYEGMFIVGIETSQGQATYHYDIDPYWSVFDCKELDRAPEWDGHTPEQAISRIASLRPSYDRDALLALADEISCTSCDKIDGELTIDLITAWGWAQVIREALGVSNEPADR